MLARLADAVVVFHLLWIIFLIFGAFVGARLVWVKWLHLGALAYSLSMQAFAWPCPLTLIEVALRRAAGYDGYAGGFIAHYAQRLVYAPVPRTPLLIATLLIVLLTLWIYFGPRPRPRR